MANLFFGLALAATACAAEALPGVVSFPIVGQSNAHGLARRTAGVQAGTLDHNQDDIQYQFYGVDVEVGTPPQNMTLGLESRYTDSWVITDCNGSFHSACFKSNQSSTLSHTPMGSVALNYGDPTTYPPSNQTFFLDYHEDVFTIAGVTIQKQPLGLPTPGTLQNTIGILGTGPNIYRDCGKGTPYNTVIENMAAQGTIASRAYSLDVGSYTDTKGVIMFGGADTGKFSGKLEKRPLVKDELGGWEPSITLDSYGQHVNGSQETYAVNEADSVFVIDSGNQYFRFRHSFVDPLLRDMGATNDGNDAYYVPCSRRDEPSSWDFQFGDKTIKVPYSNIITELWADDDGKFCWVGVLVTWKGQLVLGAPFLQSAYVSFDYESGQVALAESADCGSNVVAFGAGPDPIPELQGC